MSGVCKLCNKERELQNSHIIPEFMYQNVYDKNPKRFYTLQIDIDDMDNSKRRIEQKGLREYLLCQECESLISRYENYAAETLYGKNKKNKAYIVSSKKTNDGQYFLYNYAGVEYKNLKIFLMSILWRIIISQNTKTPPIDPTLVEKLRASILNENPLNFDEFGCVLQVIKYQQGKIAHGFILHPFMTESYGMPVLNILIDGMMYAFHLYSEQLPGRNKIFFLKEDGTMIILGRVIFQDEGLLNVLKKAFNFFGQKN